jgi:superfamily II DNA or RNA helicase
MDEDTSRQLYDYQERSIERMLNSIEQGRRGSLLYAPTGIGKSVITLKFIRTLMELGRMPKYCLYTLPPSAFNTIEEELILMGLPYRKLQVLKKDVKNLPVDQEGNPIFLEPYTVTLVKHDHLKNYGLPEYLSKISHELFFIVDEFHKAMGETIRTSVTLDLVRLCYSFVGMSATVIKSNNLDPVIMWLEQIVDFEVTEQNFWAAANGMISLTVKVPVVTHRYQLEAYFNRTEKTEYDNLMEGRMDPHEFNRAVELCYNTIEREMLTLIEEKLPQRRGIFLIVRNMKMVDRFRDQILSKGLLRTNEIHIITSSTPVNLTPTTKSPIKLLITTPQNSEGYNATKMDTVIESVYFTNQATREQLDGRTVRLGQDHEVEIYTIYAGLLKNVWDRYQQVGSMSLALKGTAKLVGLSRKQLKHIS